MKIYFASPYASHFISKDAAVLDAMRSLVRLRHLGPVLHVDEVCVRDHCIWSPLLQGQIILWNNSGRWSPETALEWCLWNLEHSGFDTLVYANTIPRKPNYGLNGVDREQTLACKLGFKIISETEAE